MWRAPAGGTAMDEAPPGPRPLWLLEPLRRLGEGEFALLAGPERIESGALALDFSTLGALTFEQPDHARFPGLQLAWEALNAPSGTTAVLNAANEMAVAAFLAGGLRFDQIHAVNHATLAALLPPTPGSLQDLLAIDAEARAVANSVVARYLS